jgi:cytidylate kinase
MRWNQTPGESTDVSAQGNADGTVIAIDGPSGSGKSSTAKGVARARDLRYLDTGAMYRAMTWWMLQHRVDVADAAAVAAACERPDITMGTDPSAPAVHVDGTDVAQAIRTPEVTGSVSAVSAVPRVRELLVARQRAVIAEARRDAAGIVVEGRDITTVVAPDAAVKLFITASAEARAQRRGKEVGTDDVAATQADLVRRDRLDSSREVSPLRLSEGVQELETTGLDLDQVVALVVALADEAAESRRSASAL